ncbi:MULTISPECIES: precorrin-6y C5,15-methyltransferase (decarboxylating) subunit CbiE [unclassified Marinomonas]|uniref:precorrin-6y C5,15-methyltransferase (decarboxylating) subunit CbiE n=1 Tax=unclassified Marinomonas TaxID=196814 RepID=UPI000A8F4D64|nr:MULTISPECIES: precorrin-6y C5,15-methyltransferase (decarboxylating) subunit CbiE [unclassified Marinomonas]
MPELTLSELDSTGSTVNELLIHVVGLGVKENVKLDQETQDILNQADYVMGSVRQLETVADYLDASDNGQVSGYRQVLPPIKELKARFESFKQDGKNNIVVLASGDPLFFGIGGWLSRHFDAKQLRFTPAVSSVQAACHKLGISLQDAQVVSVHGRPVEAIRRHLQANKTLVLLTDSNSTPQVLAKECIDAGLSQSKLHICEAIGYQQEKLSHFIAADLVELKSLVFDSLNVVVIETSNQTSFFPEFPGIEDEKYITDKGDGKGMITKRDVRLSILSLLQICDTDVVWDVGAGCGGVAIEMSYWHEKAHIYAVEHHLGRQECLSANRTRFGVMNNLSLVSGRAPESLLTLPKPNKVFIGGSDGNLDSILSHAWQTLDTNGVLVASAVTENTKLALQQFFQARLEAGDAETESKQVSQSKLDLLAGQQVYRPSLPVTLFRFRKLN